MNQDAESLDILQLITTCLCVIDLTSDVSIAISEEEIFSSVLVTGIDLDIDTGQGLTIQVTDLQLTEVFEDCHLQLVLVESLELLDISTIDFDH